MLAEIYPKIDTCHQSQYKHVGVAFAKLQIRISNCRSTQGQRTQAWAGRIAFCPFKHISIRAEINGKAVQRNYTPLTIDYSNGTMQLLIKEYLLFLFPSRLTTQVCFQSISVAYN